MNSLEYLIQTITYVIIIIILVVVAVTIWEVLTG